MEEDSNSPDTHVPKWASGKGDPRGELCTPAMSAPRLTDASRLWTRWFPLSGFRFRGGAGSARPQRKTTSWAVAYPR